MTTLEEAVIFLLGQFSGGFPDLPEMKVVVEAYRLRELLLSHTPPVPKGRWYWLKCVTCNVDFRAIVSDDPKELLRYPDSEEMRDTAGSYNTERFLDFFETHQGHSLQAVPAQSANAEKPRPVETAQKSANV